MKNNKKTRKSGLGGKGLSILFNKTDDGELLKDASPKGNSNENLNSKNSKSKQTSSYLEIPLDKIAANPIQPRTFFDEEKIRELAESIKNYGIIEPIIVSKNGAMFKIIAGERRWKAANLAGLKSIPAIINDKQNENILEMMLIENIQREDLSIIEEARCFEIILRTKNLTHQELADKLGKSRAHISNTTRVLKLPSFVLKSIEEKKISLGQAKILVGLEKEEIEFFHQLILNNDTSVRELEKKVQNFKKQIPQKKSKKNQKVDPNLRSLEDKFREKLQTKVIIDPLKQGAKTSTIKIEYYSYEDLDNILNKIK